MDPDILRDQLTKLHEELSGARQVDPRSSVLLGEVLKDIQRILERGPGGEPPSAPPVQGSVADRLEKIAVQFEVDHPALAAGSRRLVDLLGKAGL